MSRMSSVAKECAKVASKKSINTCMESLTPNMYEKVRRSKKVECVSDDMDVNVVSLEEKVSSREIAKQEKKAAREAAKEEKKALRKAQKKEKDLGPNIIQIEVVESLKENVDRFHREHERAPTLDELNNMYKEVYA